MFQSFNTSVKFFNGPFINNAFFKFINIAHNKPCPIRKRTNIINTRKTYNIKNMRHEIFVFIQIKPILGCYCTSHKSALDKFFQRHKIFAQIAVITEIICIFLAEAHVSDVFLHLVCKIRAQFLLVAFIAIVPREFFMTTRFA